MQPARVGRRLHRSIEKRFFLPRKPFASGLSRDIGLGMGKGQHWMGSKGDQFGKGGKDGIGRRLEEREEAGPREGTQK